MEIKTTHDFERTFRLKENIGYPSTESKRWVAVDEIIQLIKEHKGCKQYHELNGKKATCLDIIFNTLKPKVNKIQEVSGNSSHK